MRRIFLLLGIWLIVPETAHGQSMQRVDSLERAFVTSDNHNKVEVLFRLTGEYYNINDKRAMKYAEIAALMVCGQSDSLQFVKAKRIYGQLLKKNERFREAVRVLKSVESVAYRTGYKDEHIKILNNLASSFTYIANYDQALKYNFKSLSIRESENNEVAASIVHNNIGVVYMALNNYEKAMEHFEKSLRLKTKHQDRYDLDRLWINIGLCHNGLQNVKEGERSIYKGLKTCGDNCSEQIKLEAFTGLAVSYLQEMKTGEAKHYLNLAITRATNNDNRRFLSENLIVLGGIYLKQSKLDSAFFCLKKAEMLASDYPQLLIDVYKKLYQLFERSKNLKKTAMYQKKYIVFSDSIFSDRLTQNLMALQSEHEQRENIGKIEVQRKIISLNEQIIARQYWLNATAVIALILFIALVTLLYLANRQKKLINHRLEEKVKERTIDLEFSYNSLQRVYADQNYVISRASEEMKNPLMTLQGICSLASKEHPSAKEYIVKIDEIAAQLTRIINSRLTVGTSSQS